MIATNKAASALAKSGLTKAKSGLTKSEKHWDIDGDGALDAAELALKKMDKEKKGELSREEVYALMSENLSTQRDLFKMKKIVAVLVAITCVLALSNLGTSFAAAWLSKDTKSVDGALVDKASGQTIKTDTYANVYTGIDDANRRELCEEDTDGIVNCETTGFNMPNAQALAMLQKCFDGSTVDLHIQTKTTVESFSICGNGHEATYVVNKFGTPTHATSIITMNGNLFSVTPEDKDTVDERLLPMSPYIINKIK